MFKATVVIPAEFATRGEPFQGECTPPEMARLADELFSGQGLIHYAVGGRLDSHGRPMFTTRIAGNVQLTCQRCLQGMNFPLRVESAVVLVREESDLPDPADEQDDVDCIVDPGSMDLATLVEDEVLLALPIAPRHGEGDQACKASTAAVAAPGSIKPFAELRSLRDKAAKTDE